LDSPIERVRLAIENQTGPGRRGASGGWQLRCPAHSDRNPSLSLDANAEQHVLLYCQAGCETDAVLVAANLTRRDLYPPSAGRSRDPVVATYSYTDEDGTLLYQVLRTAAKQFRQRRPDPATAGGWVWNLHGVRRVLYRLPLVLDAIEQGLPVYVVEGEKDVHSVEARGHTGTTHPGGVGKWRPEYTEALRGAEVIVVTDRDREGQGLRHARAVAQALAPVAASVTLVQPVAGKDVTDHLTAGHALDALQLVPIHPPEQGPQAAGRADRPPDGGAVDTPVSPAPTGEQTPVNPIRVRRASSITMAPVRWVWDGRMPVGEICLIPGREGIGKSIFLAWLAAKITRGELPGIYDGQPRAVLYAAAEDSWRYTIAPRMYAAGADLDLILPIDVVDPETGVPGRLTLPQHCNHLPDRAQEYKAAVLMCDPILSNLDDRLNPNQTRELRIALEPLRRAAENAQIAVVGLAHFNKSTEGDVLSKIAGGRGWTEVARAVISIARETREHEGDERPVQVVTQSKNNLGRVDLDSLEFVIEPVTFPTDPDDAGRSEDIVTARLRWLEGVSLTSAEEILNRRHGQRNSGDGGRAANIERVLDVLDESPTAMSPREVANQLGDSVSYVTVKQILHRLSNNGDRVERVGTGLYKTRVVVTAPGGSASRARRAPYLNAGEDPPLSPSPPPPQVKGGNGDRKGERLSPLARDVAKEVARDVVTVTVTEGVSPLSPFLSPLACKECLQPLVDVDGTGVHPSCA
jgi:hypothetical protein